MTDGITGYKTTYLRLFEAHREAAETETERPSLSRIEIPLIQRDYAQGRLTDKVRDIRSTFLEALHEAVVKDQPISLDFVYGDVQDGSLLPLDGQQRLTTLFLVHWYVAVRIGRPTGNAPWTEFSYATRPSARLFCERLANAQPPNDVACLSSWLVDQPWYLYGWQHDPTIQSMLVVLDDIHRLFRNEDLDQVWDRLDDPRNPAISFYVLPIPEIGAGDDLYIKMNSRGKPLTEFENFKATFEHAIAHSPRASEIAHKFDGVWSDVLWPFHGGDNIVDDEFIRYITFLIEVCEWRTGKPTSGRLVKRATRLFGATDHASERALDFFEQAFDIWVGEDIPAYFAGLCRTSTDTTPDERPTLFAPDGLEGVNLFALCCRVYGDRRDARARAFPLGLTILLFAILVHRIHRTPCFLARLRTLRNLVEASDNEIRLERMQALLAEAEGFIRDGELTSMKTFNQAQVADELRKATFLQQHPDAKPAIHALEDHRLLRGTLAAFDLDPGAMASRAHAFTRVFADNTEWRELTGAFLACGDYFRRRNDLSFFFGSPTGDSWWRTLLAGPARSPLEDVRQPLARLLDRVAAAEGQLGDTYRAITQQWLTGREEARHFDWRYYVVKYPHMREGTSGIYVTETGDLGYTLCALVRSQLNSNYRDPYLLAIQRESGVHTDQVYDPWFSGYQNVPRWLRLKHNDIAMRCVEEGLMLRTPVSLREIVRKILADRPGLRETDDGFFWRTPQEEIDGHLIDAVDRVQVGSDILRRLVVELDPWLLALDSVEAREALFRRGDRLSTAIGGQLARAGNLANKWVHQQARPGTSVWVAFELSDRNCIELVLNWDDARGARFAVKAYPRYGRWNELYSEFEDIPLSADWKDADDEVVEAFLQEVRRLQESHPRP